jgi:hypothetical protein
VRWSERAEEFVLRFLHRYCRLFDPEIDRKAVDGEPV